MAGFFTGQPGSISTLPTRTGQQIGAQNQLLQQTSQGLGNTNLDYGPIKNQILKQFETETVPGLLERLQMMRGPNSRGGSSLGAQLGGSLENLGGQLAAGESQYNLSKYNSLLNALGIGLSPQFENLIQPAQPGFLHQLGGSLAGGLGSAIPLGIGAAAGGIGNLISGLLSSFGSSAGKIGSSANPSAMAATIPQNQNMNFENNYNAPFNPQLNQQQQLLLSLFGGGR